MVQVDLLFLGLQLLILCGLDGFVLLFQSGCHLLLLDLFLLQGVVLIHLLSTDLFQTVLFLFRVHLVHYFPGGDVYLVVEDGQFILATVVALDFLLDALELFVGGVYFLSDLLEVEFEVDDLDVQLV